MTRYCNIILLHTWVTETITNHDGGSATKVHTKIKTIQYTIQGIHTLRTSISDIIDASQVGRPALVDFVHKTVQFAFTNQCESSLLIIYTQ